MPQPVGDAAFRVPRMALSPNSQIASSVKTGGCVFVAIVKNCAQGERIGHVLDLIPPRIEDSASVIIPETFCGTDFGKRLDDIQHFLQYVVELLGNREAVLARKDSRVQEKIERVYVVVKRLLEVNAVGADLPFRLFQYDAPSVILPAFCGRNLRAQRADEEKRNRLAEEVSVGREIRRQIAFDISSMRLQSEKKIRLEGSRKVRAVSEQIPNPEPGQAAECHFERAGPVDAERIRIRLLPRMPLVDEFIGIDAIAGQEPSFGQRDQMLVAVQFPDDFVIADCVKIQKIDLEPGFERTAAFSVSENASRCPGRSRAFRIPANETRAGKCRRLRE